MNLKTSRPCVWMAAVVLAVVLVWTAPAFKAQSQSPNQGAQQQPDQQQSQPQQNQTKTYVGQVIQAKNGQYALLTDKTAGRGYFLDDQAKAKKFNGQNVKVTGKVDTQTKTLHIAQIEPLQQ